MNHTLEELHQSREQVHHYQKLQTIGALTGGIVHEFNNLLTPIIGYSEFIKPLDHSRLSEAIRKLLSQKDTNP